MVTWVYLCFEIMPVPGHTHLFFVFFLFYVRPMYKFVLCWFTFLPWSLVLCVALRLCGGIVILTSFYAVNLLTLEG